MGNESVRAVILVAMVCVAEISRVTLAVSTTIPYIRPEDCSWNVMPETRDVSMTCNVHTLQGGTNPTNFSLIMPRRMVHLAIKCDDDDIRKSAMVNSSFKHLHYLQELDIESCRLDLLPSGAFAGLANLRTLTVKKSNTRAGKLSLRVSPTSFKPLENIESVNLSENNLKELPERLLCGLNELRFLNLTRNSFVNVANIGFSIEAQCNPTVDKLEMAHNMLRVLPDRGLASLTHLSELRVSDNQIARVEPNALAGLAKLKHLDMAHNRLVALPGTLFQSTPHISTLYLRNNSLSALPPGLLGGLREVTILDLAHNQLSSLEWLGSEGSSHLTELDLSYNRLTRIDSRPFRSMVNTQCLYLQNNLIEYIRDDTFSTLPKLHTLILSANRLKHVNVNLFVGLTVIATLHLDNNRLETIDGDTFKNNSMIQELNLSGNKLRVVPDSVSSLKKLFSLDLSENEIVNVVDAPYQGLGHLHALNLMGNKIGNINSNAFRRTPMVRSLNLARNRIRAIEQGTFGDVPRLHFLRLDANEIEDVNGLFVNLHDMTMLNISANKLRWFDYALIPTGLQWLDIHDNQIEALGNYFDLVQNMTLRTLDASSNRLTDIDATSLPNGIEVVFLNNNSIKRIQPFAFLGKHNLTRVELTNNLLTDVEMAMLRVSETPAPHRPLPEFAIAGNPYICHCHMDWLQRVQKSPASATKEPHKFPRIVDLHNIECRSGFGKRTHIRPLVSLRPSEFLCRYRGHCAPPCHCCEFEACYCEVICPANCTCYHDPSWNSNIVDCSSSEQSAVPKQLPLGVTVVHLDGNDIGALNPLPFVRREKIELMFANQSNIATIEPDTFASLARLRVLHLEDNQISELRGQEFTGLSSLRELYLSNNQLTFVSNVTFGELQSLEVLHLDRNYLIKIPIWFLQHNKLLIELSLSANPWTCGCDFTRQLATYIRERGDTISDIFDMSCVHNETTALQLWELNITDCHGLSETIQLREQVRFLPSGNLFTLLFILCAVLLLLFVIAAVSLLVYRRKSGVFLFSRCGVRTFYHPPIEEEKLFDVFVSYSRKDEDFVCQNIASELESGKSAYRLCLHHRDLPVTGQYLYDAIHEAVECSRKTILVISESFLRSDWSVYEFKSAHRHALQSRAQKLIIISIGRVCYSELDLDIRTWIKHSTWLQWGEKDFEGKLRSALPAARQRNPLCSDVTSVGMHL